MKSPLCSAIFSLMICSFSATSALAQANLDNSISGWSVLTASDKFTDERQLLIVTPQVQSTIIGDALVIQWRESGKHQLGLMLQSRQLCLSDCRLLVRFDDGEVMTFKVALSPSGDTVLPVDERTHAQLLLLMQVHKRMRLKLDFDDYKMFDINISRFREVAPKLSAAPVPLPSE